MTKEEALKLMQAVKSYMTSGNPIWSVEPIGEAFDMAIEALQAKTDGDTISRQAALDAVYERIKQIGYENSLSILSIGQAIRDLPSAQPKTGKWIKDKHGYTVCSECGWNAPRIMVGGFTTKHLEDAESEFCWHCGAKMR